MVVLIVIAVAGAVLYAFLRPPAQAEAAVKADAGVISAEDGASEKQPLSDIRL
ncbi:hypothetical protein [Paenibacillus humicola]|uniref:hypothetical protein n=1 Tax=Paenibacillus humicola TaxID=3110540 RepID=UPI00237AF5A1|nr:hypothetical protein [Paenibacillus humicola]